jgi:ATP-binding cassette subfamily B protein
MSRSRRSRRRWLVPEVIQTSAMDCGPAVLACLLRGFGIQASYGRLREVCQTDVDGTSIDTLEAVACQTGLAAEQIMLPADHLLLPEADALPAIVVTLLPGGLTHFVLLWRRHGPLVQVMDPAVGRRWLRGRDFLREVYVHAHRVPAAAWREWAATEGFGAPLRRRLELLGLGRAAARRLLETAGGEEGWRPLARLDAATRLAASLLEGGGASRGREAGRLLESLLAPRDGRPEEDLIPESFWSVKPAPVEPGEEEAVLLRGAVLVGVTGRQAVATATLPPEVAACLRETGVRPWQAFRKLLGRPRRLSALLLLGGLGLAACAGVLEGVLFRGALDVGQDLRLPEQRLAAGGVLLLLGLLVTFVEWRLVSKLLQLGRGLELGLRLGLLEKLPRTHDRYFHSRPVSDMAERGHLLWYVRQLPRQAAQFAQAGLGLALTAVALAWLDPGGAPLAVAAAAAALLLPLLANPALVHLDLRLRTHAGALSRFYLDALLGLAAVRAHGAEKSLCREHEALLTDWARAGRRLLRAAVLVEAAQLGLGYALAGWLVLLHASRFTDAAAVLLLAYWSLGLPLLGQEVALLLRQYPLHRNLTLRLLELLGGTDVDEGVPPGVDGPEGRQSGGVVVALEGVAVRAGGHVILQDIDLTIEPGSHVAVVGASGSGKSTLVGLLLGWHYPAAGRVLVDGAPLAGERLQQLREQTAWVDPAVQLWNRPLVENLLYGAPGGAAALGEVLAGADLHEVLQRLPDGLQTRLGEGGGLVSGGEGQRVRLGRALGRRQARLVILDEPFRGLDRDQRRALLERARAAWPGVTLLCVTHDLGETRQFPRVLVLDRGRIVEDGPPEKLLADGASHYSALHAAEEELQKEVWNSPVWRQLHLQAGRLAERRPEGEP